MIRLAENNLPASERPPELEWIPESPVKEPVKSYGYDDGADDD
jgi:hypothetical protein